MQQPLAALPVFIVILLITVGFGRKILHLIGAKTSSSLESSVFGMALGLGSLGYLVLLIGLLKLLYPLVLGGLILVIGVISFGEIRTVISDIIRALRENGSARLRRTDTLIALSVVALGAAAMIAALAPPSGLDWDGLAYHLAVPKLYLNRHAVYYVPYIHHSNFPFLTEMLYTVGLAFGSTALAKLFHFVMFIGTATAIYVLGSKHVSSMTGKIAALIYMSVPVVIAEAGTAYTDLTTAMYITLAVFALVNWEDSDRREWLFVCAAMCGFALSTKVLASVPIMAMCAWVFVRSGRSRGWGGAAGLALGLGIVSIVIGSPWYIKSFAYTGNPVYPFLYNVFTHTRNWSQADADAYRASQLAFGMGRGMSSLLLAPWNLAMNGFKFYDTPTPTGLIGMTFLGLVPVYILTRKPNGAILRIGFVAISGLAAWFVLMQYSRYLVSVLPLFSLVAAAGLVAANEEWKSGRHVVNTFLGVSVAIGLVLSLTVAMLGVRSVMGLEPKSDYLSRTLDVYRAEDYVNTVLPQNAKIVLFDEVRGFYLDREYIWGNPGHHEQIPWATFKTGGDMVAFFRSHGYTHALMNGKFGQGQDAMHMKLIPEAVGRGLMSVVESWNGVTIYEFTGQ